MSNKIKKSTVLTETTVLVMLSIGTWSGRVRDTKAKELVESTFAATDAGNFNKILIQKARLKEITTVANVARKFHMESTLPWTDRGSRLLPTSEFAAYTKKMRELRADFDKIVAEFVSDYPELVADARVSLGGLFREDDYPDSEQINTKFNYEINFRPVPSDNHFSDLQLDDPTVEALKTEIASDMEKAQTEAMSYLWESLYKVLTALNTKMQEDDPKFRDSIITNVHKMISRIPKLNIAHDENLASIVKLVDKKLGTVDADNLKNNPTHRDTVQHETEKILEAMDGFM